MLLPPPLAGEGWGGGFAALPLRGYSLGSLLTRPAGEGACVYFFFPAFGLHIEPGIIRLD
jgi:hypothetical protein